MLMDVQLLPTYKKALANDPVAMLNFAKLLQTGKGIPINVDKALQWYENLLQLPEKSDFVDYGMLYYWAAIAAWNRRDPDSALGRLREALKIFYETFPGDAQLKEHLDEINFYNWYGFIAARKDFDLIPD